MQEQSINWTGLATLREAYLEATAGKRDYWTAHLLADYDRTFAARIGWKWDHALADLDRRGFAGHVVGPIVDWGCGTGIATRRVLAQWPSLSRLPVVVSDRSPRAMAFAARQIEANVITADPEKIPTPGVLLVSHVVTELRPKELQQLIALCRRAAAVIWVEPGTPVASRALISARESLRDVHTPIAPCGHSAPCGMLAPQNERHWCHHFAEPPQSSYHDPLWNQFADKLKIDWRSLPVSYLAMRRATTEPLPALPEALTEALTIGHPRRYKGHSVRLVCDGSGVSEKRTNRRDGPKGQGHRT